jgi:hypothetical protein
MLLLALLLVAWLRWWQPAQQAWGWGWAKGWGWRPQQAWAHLLEMRWHWRQRSHCRLLPLLLLGLRWRQEAWWLASWGCLQPELLCWQHHQLLLLALATRLVLWHWQPHQRLVSVLLVAPLLQAPQGCHPRRVRHPLAEPPSALCPAWGQLQCCLRLQAWRLLVHLQGRGL